MKAVCRFTFDKQTKRELIEASIASAFFNAESVFGKPRVRVSGAAYYLDEDIPQCIVDVSTDLDEHNAQVFIGIMINTFGEKRFQVRRIGEPYVAGATPAKREGKTGA